MTELTIADVRDAIAADDKIPMPHTIDIVDDYIYLHWNGAHSHGGPVYNALVDAELISRELPEGATALENTWNYNDFHTVRGTVLRVHRGVRS